MRVALGNDKAAAAVFVVLVKVAIGALSANCMMAALSSFGGIVFECTSKLGNANTSINSQ